MRAIVLAVALGLCAAPARAHRPSDAFLTLAVEGAELHGRIEVALRDLAALVAIDIDRDRDLTWGELRSAQPAIAAALERSLAVSAEARPCALRANDLWIHDRVEGRFAWIDLSGRCPSAPAELSVSYRLLFELDPSHRGLLVLTAGDTAQSAVFAPDHAQVALRIADPSRWAQFRDYLREGVHHIWIGADHILFLISLLLPCVVARGAGAWRGAASLGGALREVVSVVTAFTAAHSLTLTAAALGWVRLPIALTEAAIALSVLVAALNNVTPVITRGRWGVAFGFGLIHGFGFASVLGELGLPAGARLLALVAFNLGVELGQLAIVALALPLAYALRNTALYRRAVLAGGSLAIAAIAAVWFAQRSGLLEAFSGAR